MLLTFVISILVFFCIQLSSANGTPCDESGISCRFTPDEAICIITADYATANYLFYRCTTYIQSNLNSIIKYLFSLYGSNHQTFTFDIAPGVTYISFINYGNNNTIVFNNTQPDITTLNIYSPGGSLYVSQDFMSIFTNLQILYLERIKMDGFPVLNSSISYIYCYDLILPSVITLDSSIIVHLNSPISFAIRQDPSTIWFTLAEDVFDNILGIRYLILQGLQHYTSFMFADLMNLTRLSLRVDTLTTFENNSFAGLDELTHITIVDSVNIDFLLNYTFPKLEELSISNCQLTSLEQEFFHRQKSLNYVLATNNPFDCSCDLLWVNHVVDNLGWTFEGSCSTPFSLNGNAISDVSNYVNCQQTSFQCFKNTFICPSDSACVNTADTAYCDCYKAGYQIETETNTCVDIDECSISTDNCQQNCTNTLGFYNCSCEPGYTLDADLFTCVSDVTNLILFLIMGLCIFYFINGIICLITWIVWFIYTS